MSFNRSQHTFTSFYTLFSIPPRTLLELAQNRILHGTHSLGRCPERRHKVNDVPKRPGVDTERRRRAMRVRNVL